MCIVFHIFTFNIWLCLQGLGTTKFAVVCTDLTTFGQYLRPWSRFSHTDQLSSVNKSIDHHLLPWVPEVFFFFLLEATELSGEAANASRVKWREKNITYSQNDQLPDGLIAQLVEHCIRITVIKI